MTARIATTEFGSGPPVLLVYGWGGFREGWGPLPARLAAAGLRAVALDLPGHGASPAPPGFRHTPAAYAAALEPLARRLAPVSVVSHSMGAFPALLLAARAPAAVRSVALLSPAPLSVDRRDRRLAALPVAGPWLSAMRLTLWRRDEDGVLASFVRAAAHPERLEATSEAVLLAREATRRFRATPARVLARSASHALRSDARLLARRVPQPSLVVVGACDRVGTPSEARALAAALPAGRLAELPGCGHFPFVERPDALAAVLVPHLRGAA